MKYFSYSVCRGHEIVEAMSDFTNADWEMYLTEGECVSSKATIANIELELIEVDEETLMMRTDSDVDVKWIKMNKKIINSLGQYE